MDHPTDTVADPFDRALHALREAGVDARLRKPRQGEPPTEVDLWIDRRRLRVAERVLAQVGFHPFRARGQGLHRFYLGFEGGRWLKLDVKVPTRDQPAGSVRRARALRLARWRGALARRWPLGLRRLGPVVAIVGPDGAGKGTVIEGLRSRIPAATRALYLGGGASGRAGAGRATAEPSTDGRSGGGQHPRRPAGSAREGAFLLVTFARRRLGLARGYAAAWRGTIVLCDRHPLELLAVDPDRTPSGRRLERFLAAKLTPRPDAVVVLDAPAEVLFARKPEHPVERLERWRRSYAEVFGAMGASIVSTGGSPAVALDDVSLVVWNALRARRRW